MSLEKTTLYIINREVGEVKTEVKTMHQKLDKVIEDHEQRLRSVEKKNWITHGVYGTIGAALTWIFRDKM